MKRMNKMRIGIITFQETNNYGALWQNYALLKALNRIGADAETIDYRSRYIARPYRWSHLRKKGIAEYLFGLFGYIFYLFRIRGNKRFRKKIRYSGPVTACELSAWNDQYDKFITGSDQVWNCGLTDYDDVYFLSFVKDSSKKASYAASMGLKKPEASDRTWYLQHLVDYKDISVREKSAEHMLSHILKRNVRTVLDPVFLLSRAEWKNVCGKKRLIKEKYILVYQLGIAAHFVEFADRCAKYFNCRLIWLPFPLLGAVKCSCKITAGAGEVLNYICNAEYILTDSFHGTAMSVILGKKFVTDTGGMHHAVSSRILDLLDMFELQERAWDKSMVPYDLDKNIDWNRVERKWKTECKKSYRYLKRIIKE